MEQKQTISAFSRTGSMQSPLQQSGQRVRMMTSNKKAANKKLKYNSREIPTLLLNAGNSQSAQSVLIMAVDRLAYLRSSAATGQYDKTEVSNAIIHANRMVICAKTKIRNLKEEEMEKSLNDRTEDSLSEIRIKHKRSSRRQELKLKIQQLELKKKCHKHRNEERAKINAANGAYESRKGGKNTDLSFLNASENAILLELRNLEIKEREENNGNITGGTSGTDSSGTVVDVTVSGEADTAVSVDCAGIDISI